jgi:hypothetical protein
MTAVGPSLVKGPSGDLKAAPWWADGSDPADELLGHMEEYEEEYDVKRGRNRRHGPRPPTGTPPWCPPESLR